jgi:hypothetical protein
MSYQFLKAQGVPKYVSRILIDAKKNKVLFADNASITPRGKIGEWLSFDVLEGALPYPQTKGISKGLKLVPFEAEMNQQLFGVRHLEAGNYELSIDGVELGQWTADQLSAGVNLAVIKATPQYQQALKVMEISNRRGKLQSQLRDVAFVYYGSGLADSDVDMNDSEAVEAFLAKKLEANEGRSYYAYVKRQYDKFLATRAEVTAISEAIEATHAELYQANQPVSHRYGIKRL